MINDKEEAQKIADVGYDAVEEILKAMLSDTGGDEKVLLLSGALQAVFHRIEETLGSGLYSTEFIVASLQNYLENQVMMSKPNEDDVIH
tara:strand:+ start:915 stop:1181 length:267 start_codon:yes stop_codon:yes gene_type:complete